jgi:disulfide bond formation protein DsbB
MPVFYNSRLLFLAILFACAALLGSAIYIEPFKSMNPCPMCMMQRAVFALIAVFCILAAIHNPARVGQKVYATITGLTALGGAAIASRQLWLQSLPEDQIPACGPGLEYMLDVFPILDVIAMAIKGTGDCAEVQWTLASISIPGWSLLAFAVIAVISTWILFRPEASSTKEQQ